MFARFARSTALTLALAAGTGAAAQGSDIARCADEGVKTGVLPLSRLEAAEAACARVLVGAGSEADRQKAAFYRSLSRFLQVVQRGAAAAKPGKDGAIAYTPPTLAEVAPALADIETALGLDGPLRAEALQLRVTINQTIGRHSDATADIDLAMRSGKDATPFVQRALEQERTGSVVAALADLDRALELDPKLGTALWARGDLLRRVGQLARARTDYDAAAALGPPFRRLALTHKSQVELRSGNLRAAYDDLVAAIREPAGLPKADAAVADADLRIAAGDLALDKLKEPDVAATHFDAAAKLVPRNWSAALGLARVEEQRGNRDKAIAIYRRIIDSTRATPRLLERLLASYRLKMLTQPQLKHTRGPFRPAFDIGVNTGKGSPDGLKRMAFVIGVSDYTELSSLPNARRDAAVMANALAEMGFDTVEIAENVGIADLRRVPALIAEQAAQADIVLVFYAGHAVETEGSNFLIPADATPDTDAKLRNEALALGDLMGAAAKARRGSFVIVDACRDDPFVEARAVAGSRSVAGRAAAAIPERLRTGLAATPVPAANNVVFHSTQPGQTALDGDGLDSPFVRALLETLAAPGQRLDAVVQETTARVSERTQGRQVPAAYGAIPAVALLPPVAKPR